MELFERETKVYKICRPLVKAYTKLVYRPTYIGIENIPENGRIILAGNHTSGLDPILLVSSTKRQLHYLAKIELFKGKFKGWFFKHAGLIPVDRKAKDGTALKNALKTLNAEEVICIHPEGTINRTKDVILPFKIGAVKMAYETDTKIVPFVIKGKYKVFRKSITIKFLKPIHVKDEDLDKSNEKLMKVVSKELKSKEV